MREITIKDFPAPQRILYNSDKLVYNDVSPQSIIDLLDGSADYYDPMPVTITSTADTLDALEEFDIKISDEKNEDP